MRAVQVRTPTGPAAVVVRAVGVSFPDLLLSRGRYQVRPDPPVGATYDLDGFGRALQDMEDRRTLGRSVVLVS